MNSNPPPSSEPIEVSSSCASRTYGLDLDDFALLDPIEVTSELTPSCVATSAALMLAAASVSFHPAPYLLETTRVIGARPAGYTARQVVHFFFHGGHGLHVLSCKTQYRRAGSTSGKTRNEWWRLHGRRAAPADPLPLFGHEMQAEGNLPPDSSRPER